ncbi:hypothetical protein SISNIDRAFT_491173 [Sistotremastrum niveocremeum HHB9708]|uniref:F-box domain-containing protein n=2 Tax=Sistotremastraceae TaxID=3402574 RepID=A0A164N3K2_9AGAM|nr:hypothetical protein SISNIDRAFT_491173 [Sistotremastrum niveocremeum HHB9708]KZT33777.1 hypothetical protein SISSUDRAFT_1065867 [Sistotremastrum suecicum HHB10207 ss-3]
MPFNHLPLEIHEMIVVEYETDPSRVEASSKDLLKNTLALSQINRRFRALSLSDRHQDLWSIIHLLWPREAVEEFVRRCEYQDLTIFLKTRIPSNRKRTEEVERWISFFLSNMDRIVSLQLDIPLGRAGRDIADTIADTPAPRLHSLALHLDETDRENAGIRRLLDYNAPNLQQARIHANLPFELQSFPSLRVLTLRASHHNFKGLLGMLGTMTEQLEILRLNGVKRWDLQVLPPDLLAPLVLTACTFLCIANFDAHRVCYIISNIHLPNLNQLTIKEKVVQALVDGAFLSSLFPTLPRINAEGVDSLYLGIYCNRFVVEMPGYQYETNWRHLAKQQITLLPLVIDIVHALADHLDSHPITLIVESGITSSEWSEPDPAFLTLPDVDQLIDVVFAAFSWVQRLKVGGNINPPIHALFDPSQLPNLTDLIIQTQSKAKFACDYTRESLAQLAKQRKIKIARR